MINAARAVPSTYHGGGENGHIFLLKSIATYSTCTGGKGYTEATHPDDVDFTGAITNAQIANVKGTRTTALETYNTQVDTGLRKISIANVPANLLIQHEIA